MNKFKARDKPLNSSSHSYMHAYICTYNLNSLTKHRIPRSKPSRKKCFRSKWFQQMNFLKHLRKKLLKFYRKYSTKYE